MKNPPVVLTMDLTLIAMVAVMAAGIVHMVIAPWHMQHAPAHGIFFGFSGLMQIGWAIEFRASPTARMRQVGIGLSAGLILLWGLTRIAGEPFARTADPLDWGLIASKSAEIIAAVALSAMILRDSAPRVLAGGVGMALAVCLISYGGARVVEPFLPGLAEAPGEGPGHTHGAGQAAPINAAYANGMLITCAWIRPATSAEGSAALYFSITNLSGADDVLESVSTDAAGRAQIAQSREVAGGITQTALIETLAAPRGGPLILGPGGAVVLLVDVRDGLASGQIIPVRLRFARAGVIEVRAEVVEAAVTPGGP